MTTTGPIVLARFHKVDAGRNPKEVLYENNEKSQDGRVALVDTECNRLVDITGLMAGDVKVNNLQQILDWTDRLTKLQSLKAKVESGNKHNEYNNRTYDLNSKAIVLDTPIPRNMPVHAAGVTYASSVAGRNLESAGDGGGETKPDFVADKVTTQP